MEKTLIDLKKGEQGEIIGFDAGYGLQRRLESMGIRPGKIVSRVSAQALGGPITVSVDGRQCAMGRGMAAKVKIRIQ